MILNVIRTGGSGMPNAMAEITMPNASLMAGIVVSDRLIAIIARRKIAYAMRQDCTIALV